MRELLLSDEALNKSAVNRFVTGSDYPLHLRRQSVLPGPPVPAQAHRVYFAEDERTLQKNGNG